ncbi:MAG: cytochrome C' [Lautropia sp.]|nr:cytochrome C' [Lautropia sp.]
MIVPPRFGTRPAPLSAFPTLSLALCVLQMFSTAPAAWADEATTPDARLEARVQKLLKKHNCLACHQTQRKVVGPSFESVAERYASQKEDAPDLLIQSIRSGGAGKWGPIPMPPNPHIDEESLETMTRWILMN